MIDLRRSRHEGLSGLSRVGGYISFVANRRLPTCVALAFVQRMTAAGWSGESEILDNDEGGTSIGESES